MSNNSETMEVTDGEEETNEMNYQDVNSDNNDDLKKHLKVLFRLKNVRKYN